MGFFYSEDNYLFFLYKGRGNKKFLFSKSTLPRISTPRGAGAVRNVFAPV